MPIDILKKTNETSKSEKEREEAMKNERDKYWRWGIIVGLAAIIFFLIIFLFFINPPASSQDMEQDEVPEKVNVINPQMKSLFA